jgi:hypothetical protein
MIFLPDEESYFLGQNTMQSAESKPTFHPPSSVQAKQETNMKKAASTLSGLLPASCWFLVWLTLQP